MNENQLIKEQEVFKNQVLLFFRQLFESTITNNLGQIEIRAIDKGKPFSSFTSTPIKAVEDAYHLCNNGCNVFFGVNPRIGCRGKKENVHNLVTFHVDIDYGVIGHKKGSDYETVDQARQAIDAFKLKPTMLVNSGGGFHCYWILEEPVKVKDIGVETLESINKSLSIELGGDIGPHELSRILRVPGTYNLKEKKNIREAKIEYMDGPKYKYEQFSEFINVEVEKKVQSKSATQTTNQTPVVVTQPNVNLSSIESLTVPDKIKNLILNGNHGEYASRSEADMAVVLMLVNKGFDFNGVKSIFSSYPIGQKYKSHQMPDSYLQATIDKARNYSDLTDEERQDPLFINDAVQKFGDDYQLEIVNFQEYVMRKHDMKYLGDERQFFKYDGQCYVSVDQDQLNHLCQKELVNHRSLFIKSKFSEFIHFSIGADFVDSKKARADHVKYLTLENGLFDLDNGELINHTPDIFTTNLLPYPYDPDVDCPRFKQYLEEVFMNNKEMIKFVQEAVGYAFYKAIPKPALFFLVGIGSNGKSVFLDTITSLIGEENACSISLDSLSKEYYVLGLFGKMINISSETPQNKVLNTDIIKAVVGGDWVSGREPYQKPTKFKPYAKQYFAMNEVPSIEDASHGMWRRIFFINFTRTFSENEMEVFLTEKLKAELSGIFNWAYEGLKRLKASNFQFQEVESMKVMKTSYKNQNDHVADFASQYLKKRKRAEIKYGEVFNMYKFYCQSEGIKKHYTSSKLRKKLEEVGFLSGKSSKHGNQIYMFDVCLLQN